MLVSELFEEDSETNHWDQFDLVGLGAELKKDSKIKSIIVHDNGINFKRAETVFKLKLQNNDLQMFFVNPNNKDQKVRQHVKDANDVLRAAIFVNVHGMHHPEAR